MQEPHTDNKDEQIHALEQELARQAIALADLKMQLTRMEASHSWRITKPIRTARRTVHEILRHIQPNYVKRLLRRARPQTTDSYFPLPASGLPDYFVWGIIDWDFRIQRPQHLARAVAATGRRVFYISNNFIDTIVPGYNIRKLDPKLELYQINFHIDGAPSIYQNAPSARALRQLKRSLSLFLKDTHSYETVSLIQHAFWLDVANSIPNASLVYDCMDHHEGFGNVASDIMAAEERLLKTCDLLVVTSSWLENQLQKYEKPMAMIRNAGEYKRFSQVPATHYRDSKGRQIIGYYGAIAEWFDVDLVRFVAQQFPDCLILLIGGDTTNAAAQLADLPNVEMTGEVPYDKLTYYLYGFDVCMLPFRVIPLTLATNPVKVYEYLSAGKTAVSIDLPELKQFEGLVETASDYQSFAAKIGACLKAPSAQQIAARQAFAAEQTWDHRGAKLVEASESATMHPRVSVIVLTYNNLDLTEACLSSIDLYSDYPNLEVIVVDNASSDGSPDFLRKWAAATPPTGQTRRLILNDDNRGFAAGNNQGLAVATGDYMVILNNDTYVTRGWVGTMLNHFRHREKPASLGLVGPVTNNIGNEARIEITYHTMEEMAQKAHAYTTQHAGQSINVKAVAFFCTMLSRATYEKIGGLDEAFGRGFFEDDDYCQRVRQAGLDIIVADDVFVHHQLSASFNKLGSTEKQAIFDRNKAIYEAKWGTWVPHQYRKKA